MCRLLTLAVLACLYTSIAGQLDPCVNNCAGMATGDYQSCNGCNVYTSCFFGRLFDNRPCPAGLKWDDSLKRCERSSTTCPYCVRDCTGVPTGDYQSCGGCAVYATCINGLLIDNRPCPATTLWDNTVRACRFNSATCPDMIA